MNRDRNKYRRHSLMEYLRALYTPTLLRVTTPEPDIRITRAQSLTCLVLRFIFPCSQATSLWSMAVADLTPSPPYEGRNKRFIRVSLTGRPPQKSVYMTPYY